MSDAAHLFTLLGGAAVVTGVVSVLYRVIGIVQDHADRVVTPALIGAYRGHSSPPPAGSARPPTVGLTPFMMPSRPAVLLAAEAGPGLARAPAAAPTAPRRGEFQPTRVSDWMTEAPVVGPYRRELAEVIREQADAGRDVYLGPTDAEIAADALDGF